MQIKLKQVTVAYEDKIILQDIDAVFSSKQLNCIMGESGRGKTTLLYTIMGLVKPKSGEITGINKKKISIVFQEERLLEDNTVMDNILFVLPKANEEIKNKVRRACIDVGLGGYEDTYVKELSGGMKRRVSILRALLTDFDILLLDEPLKGLDYDNRLQVSQYIKDRITNTSKEIVTIMVTHNREEVDMMQGVVYGL